MSKIATINVDGLDEMTWYVVREWMLEEGVDALAVQEQKCGDVKVGKEKGKVVMGDTNDGLRGGGGNKTQWKSSFAKLGIQIIISF